MERKEASLDLEQQQEALPVRVVRERQLPFLNESVLFEKFELFRRRNFGQPTSLE